MKVGVPIGDLLAGMYGAYGVARGAARARAHRTGPARPDQPARRDRRRARLPGHPVDGRRRGADARSATSTLRSAPTACSTPPTRRSRSPAAARDCGGRSRRSSASTRTTGGSPATGCGSTRREELTGLIEAALAEHGAEHWLPVLADAGIPAGKVRTVDDVYTWEQTRSQGLVVEVDHPTVGTIELPGPPLRFDDLPYAGGRDDPPAAAPARRAQRLRARRGSSNASRAADRRTERLRMTRTVFAGGTLYDGTTNDPAPGDNAVEAGRRQVGSGLDGDEVGRLHRPGCLRASSTRTCTSCSTSRTCCGSCRRRSAFPSSRRSTTCGGLWTSASRRPGRERRRPRRQGGDRDRTRRRAPDADLDQHAVADGRPR